MEVMINLETISMVEVEMVMMSLEMNKATINCSFELGVKLHQNLAKIIFLIN
jgi:hypothetical protein